MVTQARSAKRVPRNAAKQKKVVAKKVAAAEPVVSGGSMSVEHKRALAVGREQSRAVRQYLEALAANRPKRGRKRSVEGIRTRRRSIETQLAGADPFTRVHLVQEQLDLQSELDSKGDIVDLGGLEQGFVKAAKGYSDRKGITYSAWRTVGVDSDVLRKAGIARTRS